MRYLLLRLKRFCGFITGIVFFLGGIVKIMDPVGAGLVMKEYMDFLHIGFLTPVAKLSGALFALTETVIGTALITGVWRKTVGIVALSFQVFFTLLTLLLVIFNPEMDCGCFGEAIHLTHMQTFLKNILLLALLCTYLFPAKMLGFPQKKKFVSFGIVTASVVLFSIYSWLYIPVVDFTDYKIASALKSGYSHESEEEMFEAVFIYEKDGVQESFDLEHLPDSTWTFVTTETVAAEDYQKDALIDLSFSDEDGNYQDMLATEGKVLIISLYNPDISDRRLADINSFMSDAESVGFSTLLLVSGSPDPKWPENTYYADYKTLVAMNRSNGGVTYFSNGHLVQKWAARAFPDREKLIELYNEDETETTLRQNTKGSLGFQGFLLYIFAVMLLL